MELAPLDAAALTDGIRARFVRDINGLTMHVLESGFDKPDRPCVLLLHGFPELAYSWRKIMPLLAAAGFHVIAPDQRGYGRTTGWDAAYDTDLRSFRFFNIVRDALGLVFALIIATERKMSGRSSAHQAAMGAPKSWPMMAATER